MKNLVVVFVILLSVQIVRGQEQPDAFQVSFSTGLYFDNDVLGPSATLDFGYHWKNNLLKASAFYGIEAIEFLGDGNDSNQSYDVMYGRRIKINERWYVDGLVGVGHFIYHQYRGNDSKEMRSSGIGFPIQLRLGFQGKRAFGMGIQLHTNINSLNTLGNVGVYVNWSIH